jgi:hypothetical protein
MRQTRSISAGAASGVIPTPRPPHPGTSPRPHNVGRSDLTADAPDARASIAAEAAAGTAAEHTMWRGPPDFTAAEEAQGPRTAPELDDAAMTQAPSRHLAEPGRGEIGLGDVTIRRLHAAGLELHLAAVLTEVPEATQRLDRAMAELDGAIGEIRRMIFGLHVGDPAFPYNGGSRVPLREPISRRD